jgi:hypothetical protein
MTHEYAPPAARVTATLASWSTLALTQNPKPEQPVSDQPSWLKATSTGCLVAMIDSERRSRMTQGPDNGTSEAIRTE